MSTTTKRRIKPGHLALALVLSQVLIMLSPLGLGVIISLNMVNPYRVRQVAAADGAVGGIAVSTTMIIEGLPLAIEAYDLTNGADYLINHTNDNTGVSFTASGTTYDWAYPNVASPSSGSTITVYLRAQSAGTSLASATVVVFALTDFLATAVIITAGVFVLIVVVIKGVARRRG